MGTNIILVAVGITALWGLRLHYKTINLQIKNLGASIFNDITTRINEIIDTEPSDSDKQEKERWFCLLYNAFELFAFYANRSYLNDEMVRYYKSFIETYNNRVKGLPSLIAMFKEEQSCDQYEELRRLFPTLPF